MFALVLEVTIIAVSHLDFSGFVVEEFWVLGMGTWIFLRCKSFLENANAHVFLTKDLPGEKGNKQRHENITAIQDDEYTRDFMLMSLGPQKTGVQRKMHRKFKF